MLAFQFHYNNLDCLYTFAAASLFASVSLSAIWNIETEAMATVFTQQQWWSGLIMQGHCSDGCTSSPTPAPVSQGLKKHLDIGTWCVQLVASKLYKDRFPGIMLGTPIADWIAYEN